LECAAVNLPTLNTVRRNIRRRCRRDQLPNPQFRAVIPDLPQQYQVTSVGEQFCQFDSGVGDDNRIFIFATNQGLEWLTNSDHWFCDGTFKVCPKIFYQVYTIHAYTNGRVIPCVFSLLPNKTAETYRRLFAGVAVLANPPQDILCDYEKAAMNIINELFPKIQVKGCFYHLCANIWKHIQVSGLQQRYQEEEEFSLQLRMLAALAFVPEHRLVEYFD